MYTHSCIGFNGYYEHTFFFILFAILCNFVHGKLPAAQPSDDHAMPDRIAYITRDNMMNYQALIIRMVLCKKKDTNFS